MDNLYAIAQSQRDAELMLEAVGEHLAAQWGLSFKPSSLISMAPAGSPDELEEDATWSRGSVFPVLGHIVRSDGRQIDDVTAGVRSAWAAWYANPGQLRRDPGASLRLRLRLQDRTATAAWTWRASVWAPTRRLAIQLNATQRRMTAALLTMAPRPGEAIEQYVRRRGRAAGVLCRTRGL